MRCQSSGVSFLKIRCNDSCPKIYCVVDTGVGATYGNSEFCGKIAISFPHILHSTVVASKAGHDPLTFSDVVGEDGGIVTTTESPITMTFYTPYFNSSLGSPQERKAKEAVDGDSRTCCHGQQH